MIYTNPIVIENTERFFSELRANETFGALLDSGTAKESGISLVFSAPVAAVDVDAFISAFVDEPESEMKIIALAKEEAKNKHIHNIDYTTELTQSLYPKRTFVQGELNKVEWFSDTGLTDLVLIVDIVYVRDAFGFATDRTTVRTWYRADGSAWEETKTTNKLYTINVLDQIVEGKRRRQNIVDGVQLPVMAFLMETLYPASAASIVLTGRDFLDRMDPLFRAFVENSSSVTDDQDPNFGKKHVVVELENATDTWLDGTPSALGGATIRQYLIGEFSI